MKRFQVRVEVGALLNVKALTAADARRVANAAAERAMRQISSQVGLAMADDPVDIGDEDFGGDEPVIVLRP